MKGTDWALIFLFGSMFMLCVGIAVGFIIRCWRTPGDKSIWD